jgi:hypothetical protein
MTSVFGSDWFSSSSDFLILLYPCVVDGGVNLKTEAAPDIHAREQYIKEQQNSNSAGQADNQQWYTEQKATTAEVQ